MTADRGVLAFVTQAQPPFSVHGFEILHETCLTEPDAEPDAIRLSACLDRDGLSLLLSFLSAGPGRPDEPGLVVSDLDEFVDVIRRLQVPFYEPARARFGEPEVCASLRGADRASPYQSPSLGRLTHNRAEAGGRL